MFFILFSYITSHFSSKLLTCTYFFTWKTFLLSMSISISHSIWSFRCFVIEFFLIVFFLSPYFVCFLYSPLFFFFFSDTFSPDFNLSLSPSLSLSGSLSLSDFTCFSWSLLHLENAFVYSLNLPKYVNSSQDVSEEI